MSQDQICKHCGLPIFHGVVSTTLSQCKCQWTTKYPEHAIGKLSYEQLEHLNAALRDKCAELEKDVQVAKGQYEQEAKQHNATLDLLLSAQRQLDEAAKQAVWQPLVGPGQIREGMKIRFVLSGKNVAATAKLILRAGTDREEVVYNRAKNHYFITSMAMDGTSAHKSVEFLSGPNLPALIEQAKAEERELCLQAVPAKRFYVQGDSSSISLIKNGWNDACDSMLAAIRARKP